ncbi:putative membrane protein [Shigella flexneri 1235-66]|nr:putative membrane protein [Shigella flexneri 1235-66]
MKNRQDNPLECSILFGSLYRYFMLTNALFLFIYSEKQNIIFS